MPLLEDKEKYRETQRGECINQSRKDAYRRGEAARLINDVEYEIVDQESCRERGADERQCRGTLDRHSVEPDRGMLWHSILFHLSWR